MPVGDLHYARVVPRHAGQDVASGNPLPVTLDGETDTDTTRSSTTLTANIANGQSISDTEIDFTHYAMMTIHMPTAWTAASIGFQVSPSSGGTFQPLYDQLGNIVQIAGSVASRDYAVPAEVAGCRYVKLWSQNGAGVNVAQGGNRTIGVSLKS